MEDLQSRLEKLSAALHQFDADCADALEAAGTFEGLNDAQPDIMPREEIFLVSSFLLNVRQAGWVFSAFRQYR